MAHAYVVVDLSQVSAMLQEVFARKDLKKGLGKVIGEILCKDALRQFQAGGLDPAWTPLKPATIKQKERLGYPRLSRSATAPPSLVQAGSFGPANILERTGALLSSWSDQNDPNHYEKINSDSIESGSTLFYAQYHQDPKPGSKNPKRAIGITDQAKAEIAEAIEKFIGGT